MSYTERACAIDFSLQSLLQHHSIKETGADIWHQRFHSVYKNIRLWPSTRRRIDGVFKFNLSTLESVFEFMRLRWAFSSSSCGRGLRVDVVQGNSNMALIIAGWACIYNYLQSWAWVKMNEVILTQFSPASILASKYFFFQFLSSRILKMSDHILQIQF